MLVTLLGITMEVKLEQLWNAVPFMLVTLLGITTEGKECSKFQILKVYKEILVFT